MPYIGETILLYNKNIKIIDLTQKEDKSVISIVIRIMPYYYSALPGDAGHELSCMCMFKIVK